MNPQRKKATTAITIYFSNVVASGLLIMWGTMNFVHNVRVYFQNEPDKNWLFASLFIAATAIAPFAIGIWLVTRLMANPSKQAGAQE